MSLIEQHLQLLGWEVTDRVTGFSGVVSCVSFDLYGCIQATVQPPHEASLGKTPDARWFDVSRLQVLPDRVRVMPVPAYDFTPATIATGGHGPAEKPLP
jgi:hypothetical protein